MEKGSAFQILNNHQNESALAKAILKDNNTIPSILTTSPDALDRYFSHI
jgi:hypothetical protein